MTWDTQVNDPLRVRLKTAAPPKATGCGHGAAPKGSRDGIMLPHIETLFREEASSRNGIMNLTARSSAC